MTDEEFQYQLGAARAINRANQAVAEKQVAGMMGQAQEALDWTAKQQAFAQADPFFQSSGPVPEQPWQAQERQAYRDNFVTPFEGGNNWIADTAQAILTGGSSALRNIHALAAQAMPNTGAIQNVQESLGLEPETDYSPGDEVAKKQLWRNQMESQENQRGKSPGRQEFVRAVEGVSRTAVEMLEAAALKLPASRFIAYHGANAANQSYYEAKSRGFDEKSSLTYGAMNGVVEAGLTALFGRFMGHGTEAIGQAKLVAAKSIADVVKRVGWGVFAENLEENAISLTQAVMGEMTTVQPGAILDEQTGQVSLSKLAQIMRETTTQTTFITGASGTARELSAARPDPIEQAAHGTVRNLDPESRRKLALVWASKVDENGVPRDGKDATVSRKEVESVFGPRIPVTLGSVEARTAAARVAWKIESNVSAVKSSEERAAFDEKLKAKDARLAEIEQQTKQSRQAVEDRREYESAYAELVDEGLTRPENEDVVARIERNQAEAAARPVRTVPGERETIPVGAKPLPPEPQAPNVDLALDQFYEERIPLADGVESPEPRVAGYIEGPVHRQGYNPEVKGYLPYTAGGDEGGEISTSQSGPYTPPPSGGAPNVVTETVETTTPPPGKGSAKEKAARKAKAVAESLTKLSTTKKTKLVKIADLRAQHPELSKDEFDKLILDGARDEKWYLNTPEGNRVVLTPEQIAGGIPAENGKTFAYITPPDKPDADETRGLSFREANSTSPVVGQTADKAEFERAFFELLDEKEFDQAPSREEVEARILKNRDDERKRTQHNGEKGAKKSADEQAENDVAKWQKDASARKTLHSRIQQLLSSEDVSEKSAKSDAKFVTEAAQDTPLDEMSATAKAIRESMDKVATDKGYTGEDVAKYSKAALKALARKAAKDYSGAKTVAVAREELVNASKALETSKNVPRVVEKAMGILLDSDDSTPISDLTPKQQLVIQDAMTALSAPTIKITLAEARSASESLERMKKGGEKADDPIAQQYLDRAGGDIKKARKLLNDDTLRVGETTGPNEAPAVEDESDAEKSTRALKNAARRKTKGKDNDEDSQFSPMPARVGGTNKSGRGGKKGAKQQPPAKPVRNVPPLDERLTRVPYAMVEGIQTFFNETFGLNLRYSRGFLAEGVRGAFDETGKVVHIESGDVEGVLHEQGHALRPVLWGNSVPGMAAEFELAELGYDLHGEDINPVKALSEGTAEVFRLFVTAPQYLQMVAPNAEAWFRSALEPDQLAALVVMQGQVQGFASLPAFDRNVGRLNTDTKYGLEAAIAKVKEWWDDKWRISWSAIWNTKGADKSVKERTGKAVLVDKWRATQHQAKAIADHMLTVGMIDGHGRRVGQSFFAHIAQLKGQGEEAYKAVNLFAQALRGRALQNRIDEKDVKQSGLSNADIHEILQDPRFEGYESMLLGLVEFNDQFLDYLASKSPAMAWQIEKIRREDPGFYFPLKRRMDDAGKDDEAEFRKAFLGGLKSAGKGSLSKKLEGATNLETIPILESMVNQVHSLVRMSQMRQFMETVIDLVDSGNIDAKYAHRLMRGPETDRELSQENVYAHVVPRDTGKVDEDTGEPIYEDETRYYLINQKWMKEILDNSQGSGSRVIAKMPLVGSLLKTTNHWMVSVLALRLNPAYVAFGVPIQDLPALIKNTRSGANPVKIVSKWIKLANKLAMYHTNPEWFKNDPELKMFFAMGLESNTRASTEGPSALKMLEDHLREGAAGVAVRSYNEMMNRAMNVTAATQQATNMTEMALVGERLAHARYMEHLKNGGAKKTKKQIHEDFWNNLTEDDQIQMGAAANSILPIGEKGLIWRELDLLFPFASIPLTATKATVEAFGRNPRRVAAVGGVVYFMAGLAIALKNRDEEWWKDMPVDLKYRFGITKIGDTLTHVDLSGTDFMLGIGQVVGSALLGDESPQQVGPELLKAMLAGYLSPRDAPLFQLVGLMTNEKNPVSSMLGQREGDIVPERLLGAKAKDQWDENTGTLAKEIGRRIPGVGPKRFGHIANTTTGGVFGRVEKVVEEGPLSLFSSRLTFPNGTAGTIWDSKDYRRLREVQAISESIMQDKDEPPTKTEKDRDYVLQEGRMVINSLTRLKGLAKDKEIAARIQELGLVSDAAKAQQELTEMQKSAVKKTLEAWDSLTAARPLRGDAKYLRKLLKEPE